MSENFRDPFWLEQQYIDLNKSIAEIAQECGTDEYAVSFYIEMYGLKTN
jgi:hypothetical protein